MNPGRKLTFTEDSFRKVIAAVSGPTEAMRELNSRNYVTIYKYVKVWNVDVSHWKSKVRKYENLDTSKYRSPGGLRNCYLKLVDETCMECGINPSWNGKHLTLQVHHINGNSRDNRFENLQLLCPNCHTQTDTYCGRKGKSSIMIKR